jgi:hypothetical protein
MSASATTSRIGAAVVAAGTVAVVLALTAFPWFHVTQSSGFFPSFFATTTSPHFTDVHSAIDSFRIYLEQQKVAQYYSFSAAASYFSWLGWGLLAVAAALGAVAVSPVGDNYWTPRWLAAVTAFAGGALTVTALDLVSVAGNPPANARPPSFGDFVSEAGIAPWVAVAGYTLILAGSFAPHPVDSAR